MTPSKPILIRILALLAVPPLILTAVVVGTVVAVFGDRQ